MQKLQRTLQTFIHNTLELKSESSKEKALNALGKFEKFSKTHYQKSIDNLIDEISDEEVAFDILQEWLNWMAKSLHPRTIVNYFSVVRQYLHYKGLKFHPLDIKQNLVFPKIHEYEKYGLSLEDIKLILNGVPYRRKMLYLTQLSSGMRIGEIVQLRKEHFDLTKDRIMIRIPAEFNKNRRERVTFVSSEAQKLLKPVLDQKNNNDLIFTKNPNWMKAKAAQMKYLEKTVDQLFPNQRYSTGIRKITSHSFRAYFITKTSRIDPNLAKRLAGQKGYMLQYDRLSDDEKLNLYLKMEPELLIDNSEIIQQNQEKLNGTIENQAKDIEKLKKMINIMQISLSIPKC